MAPTIDKGDKGGGVLFENEAKLLETGRRSVPFRSWLRRRLDDSHLSDITIQTSTQEYKVHKIVICGHSEFFSRLCEGQWKESQDNVVSLMDDDPDAIKAMIQFMYKFDYECTLDGAPAVFFSMNVYNVADKYIIPGLKRDTVQHFAKTARELGNLDDILPEIIRKVYAITRNGDTELRSIVAQICHERIGNLMNRNEFTAALRDVREFGLDLTRCLVEVNSAVTTCLCSKCKYMNYYDKKSKKPTRCYLCDQRV